MSAFSRQPASSAPDVPPALALLGLGLVVGGLLFMESPTTLSRLTAVLDAFVDRNATLVAATLFATAVNAVWIYSSAVRAFGLNKQGGRLEVLTGRKANQNKLSFLTVLGSLGLAAATYLLLSVLDVPQTAILKILRLQPLYTQRIIDGLRINFSLNALVFGLALARSSLFKGFGGFKKHALPPMPKPESGLVIGSLGDDEDGPKEWAVLGRKALNGNILITGSIGSGKTQGTILPFFDQILGNFPLRPSILAIDPKGTFIPQALKIIKKHGLEHHVLHMKLGGNVTFNPIAHPQLLKGANFLDIAQMIRAAAVNFMGRSFDSPFWEISAFNLIKSCLALCAAKYRESGASLTELYAEMVEASKDSHATASQLREWLIDPTRNFDEEERFNIECAARYFEEYEQLDQKVKTGILATSTAFLNQFQEFQAAQIFCPSQDKATIKSMDEVVDGGKILLFDIASPALAKSMGTFIKLHFQQSVLNRLTNPVRGTERTAVLITDEYQDVVSTGGGMTIGDDRFCAKNREANGITIAATQSLTSLKNSIGKEDSAKELFQNFRTVISGQSSDLATIKNSQELAGQEDRKRVSHSVSENAQHPSRNLMMGGFETSDANITESISTSEHKEHLVTGKEFSRLTTFESFALIYDGIRTEFRKLFLKPYFLPKKNLLHGQILERLSAAALIMGLLGSPKHAQAFPNVCTVVKSSEFRSCLDMKVSVCMCGFPIPRPCAHFEYYVPQTFIETHPNPRESFFSDLPGAAVQLGTIGSALPYGAESDGDTQSFHAHALGVPLAMIPFSLLPCGPNRIETFCFDGMSEHLGSNWTTGAADVWQPSMLAWSLSPKACMAKGALSSFNGGAEQPYGGVLGCSIPMDWLPKYPPSTHSACNGWGVFYPRTGVYNGPSQTTGALMVASRMKSLGSEIFHATPSSGDEQWQMTYPQTSSCFREGQNVGILDTVKNVREVGRLTSGKVKGHLFTVWSKVSCCRDVAEVPLAYLAVEGINLACQGLGAL